MTGWLSGISADWKVGIQTFLIFKNLRREKQENEGIFPVGLTENGGVWAFILLL
jgi:hypothetical protein